MENMRNCMNRKQNGTIGEVIKMSKVFVILFDKEMRLNREFLTVEIIAAILEKNGVNNEIISVEYDKEILNEDELRKVDWEKIKFVGIPFMYEESDKIKSVMQIIKSINPTIHIAFLYEVLPITKDSHKLNNTKLSTNMFLGGLNILECVQEIFDEFLHVDSLILGEPEVTLLDLVNCVLKNKTLEKCNGIAYRIHNGFICTESRELIKDLDKIPFAKRTYLERFKSKTARILTSRGCAGQCTFCAESRVYNYNNGQPKWRGRSPKNIVDEMEYLNKQYGVTNYSILDNSIEDPISNNFKRLNDICDEIIKRKLDIFYTVHMRAENVNKFDTVLLKKLKESGLLRVCIGIESGYEQTLTLFNKIASVNENIAAIRKLHDNGINFYVGFIMYHPYTTKKELIENYNFIKQLGIGYLNIFNTELWLYKNTPLYFKVKNDNLLCQKNIAGHPIGYVFKDEEIIMYYKMSKKYFKNKCLLQDGNLALVNDLIKKREKYGKLPDLYFQMKKRINEYLVALNDLQLKLFEGIIFQHECSLLDELREKIDILDLNMEDNTNKFLIAEARYSFKNKS